MQAEDDELDDEDWHVRHRDGGHLIAAEKSHHERIEKAERRGDQILHDDRQRQQKKMLVKALGLLKIGEHKNLECWNYSMGKRVSRWVLRAETSASISSVVVSGPKLTRSTPAAVFLSRPIAR